MSSWLGEGCGLIECCFVRSGKEAKGEPGEVVNGEQVMLFPRVLESKGFQPEGSCVSVVCEMLTVAMGFRRQINCAWEAEFISGGHKSFISGGCGGGLRRWKDSAHAEVWKLSR